MGLKAHPQQEYFAIYTFIFLWKQYFQLLNWHKTVTYITILTFFLENCWFNHKLAPLMPHVIVLKDHPHHLTKYEGKGTKISIFKLFSELGKIWKCNLSFSKIPISHLFMNWEKLGNIHIPRPKFYTPNVEFMDELGKLMS